MSVTKPIITLPAKWLEASTQWARRSVAGYANGDKENSRIYARPGIDRSVDKQFLGKAGECAFCLHVGLDPGLLDWGPALDPGWDVRHCGWLIDVKATDTEYLMWPVTKNHFLAQTKADIFVMVRRFDRAGAFELSGWIFQFDFIARHRIAPPPSFMDADTKHLHGSALWPVDELIACEAPDIAHLLKEFGGSTPQCWSAWNRRNDLYERGLQRERAA